MCEIEEGGGVAQKQSQDTARGLNSEPRISKQHFSFHISPRLCPSTTGCSPPSMPSIDVCLLLFYSRWFPSSLLCRLVIFSMVVPLISSLSLVATLCSVWSTYCPSFLLYVWPIFFQFCFSVFSVMSNIFVPYLISQHGTLSCCFKFNIFLSIALVLSIAQNDLCSVLLLFTLV